MGLASNSSPLEDEDEESEKDVEDNSDVIVLASFGKKTALAKKPTSLSFKLRAKRKTSSAITAQVKLGSKIVTIASIRRSYKKGRYRQQLRLNKEGKKIVRKLIKQGNNKKIFRINSTDRTGKAKLNLRLNQLKLK